MGSDIVVYGRVGYFVVDCSVGVGCSAVGMTVLLV